MRVKFPRTMHLPFSPGISSDDKIITTTKFLENREVIVTEKMDGENTTLYHDYMHARSIDSRHHESRNWVKNYHSSIAHLIPNGYRVCGENLYAKHSVAYDSLHSYFYGFSIWDETNCALDWDSTIEWFEVLEITPVPVLYRGPFELRKLESLSKEINTDCVEGFVVRTVDSIPYHMYNLQVAKWVRSGHVQTDQHWQHSQIVPNGLK